MVLCGLTAGLAQDFSDGAGTSEFQYLETLIFARPAGLAGAYTSLAQGIDAVGYNPAGVSKSEGARTVSGTFRYHFLNVSSGNATYGFPGAGGMSYAFSAAYLNSGRIDEVDEDGDATGRELIPASFNPSFTASRKASERLRVGATFKGLSEYLGDYDGSQIALGWGLDVGLLYQPNVRNLGFGLALLNLGRKEIAHSLDGRTGGPLPVSLKGGFFYFPPGPAQGQGGGGRRSPLERRAPPGRRRRIRLLAPLHRARGKPHRLDGSAALLPHGYG